MWRFLSAACLGLALLQPVAAQSTCSSSAGFFPAPFTSTPDTLFLDRGPEGADTVTVDVAIGGPSLITDYYGFTLDVVFGDPDLVELVSATPGAALDTTGCDNDSVALASLSGDRLLVGVTKLGDCPGNAIESNQETVVSLELRFLRPGETTIAIAAQPSVWNASGQLINGVVFSDEEGSAFMAEDTDGDFVPDCLDNCAVVANGIQQNSDLDLLGDACDNCPFDFNPTQSDSDADSQGDHCDLDDSMIYLGFTDPSSVDWQDESGFDRWNLYRGSLDTLRDSGVYTQTEAEGGPAGRSCGLTNPFLQDDLAPPVGKASFYLVTGSGSEGEIALGLTGAGASRPLDLPCPDGLACNSFPGIAEGDACSDALDNDCDGLVDCVDPDCSDTPECDVVQILRADFNLGSQGFSYRDDTFRSTDAPSYADGAPIASGGFDGGALEVTLGGVNNVQVLGMSGGWETDFVVLAAGTVTIRVRYELTQTSEYEPDERSEVLVAVDGVLYGVSGSDYVDQLAGDGPLGNALSTGWRVFEIAPTLSAGSHLLTIGGYNNKKTFFDESTTVRFDDLLIEGRSSVECEGDPVAETCDGTDNDCDGAVDEEFADLGQSCSAGVGACLVTGQRVCSLDGGSTICDAAPGAPETEVCSDGADNDCDGSVDCLDTDCVTAPACNGIELLFADFDSPGSSDGFVYGDDAFRNTANPAQASGSLLGSGGFIGGALEVRLGSNNATPVVGLSGGWQLDFDAGGGGNLVLSFRYKLTQASGYDPGERSEVLVSLDGSLIGAPPNDWVAQLNGDGNGGEEMTTGWQLVDLDLGFVTAGTHSLIIGGYNNQKNFFNEWSVILIDEVRLGP